MINPICPFCKKYSFSIDIDSINCSHHDFRFRCYVEDDNIENFYEYQIDIALNDVWYGFDSNTIENYTKLFIVSGVSGIEIKKLITINTFTPVPESKEDAENHVRRLLNLKAFF